MQRKTICCWYLALTLFLAKFVELDSNVIPYSILSLSELTIRDVGDKRNCFNCSPWTTCVNQTCICRENLEKLLIKCTGSKEQLKSVHCHCVTYNNQTNQVQVGSCIEGCTFGTNKPGAYYDLPTDPTKINTFMCEKKWNRTGRLCGRCRRGYAPLAYSYDLRCIKCPQGIANIWKYILVAYGPLTLFYFIVLFFKINATTSHLHGFLYYSQAVSIPTFLQVIYISVAKNPKYIPLFYVIVPIYSIWNLDILRSFNLEICLDVSTLTLIALNWGLAMYPLLLTLISFFMIELHDRNYRLIVWLGKPFYCIFSALKRNWNVRNSIIDAYVTFFVLSFVKLLNISVDILTPSKVTELPGGNSTWAMYYDGTVDYFGPTHLPYAIFTIIIDLVMIVVPLLLLLLYPFRWFQCLLSCLRVKGHILQTFMDSFQGCYKDGTEPGTRDYRWFAAAPLIVRVLAFLLLPSALDSSCFPRVTAVIILGLLVTIVLQPYKEKFAHYTKIDCFFLAFLSITFVMVDGKDLSTFFHPQSLRISIILLGISFVVPMFYVMVILLYWFLRKIKQSGRWWNRFKAQMAGYQDIEEDLPDRLVNSQYYRRSRLDNTASLSIKADMDTY